MPSRRWIGLALGPALFITLAALPELGGLEGPARYAVAVTAWMAAWWVTEAIPLAATALLPIVLFPLTGVLPASEVTPSYGNPLIFLFLGGFFLSVAVEKWGLHKRIALRILLAFGLEPRKIVLGFMTATAFLSLWISNSATAMLMAPIGLAVARHLTPPPPPGTTDTPCGPREEDSDGPLPFGVPIMLGIAYGASIGGVGTLIGSPPNAVFAGYVQTALNETITFVQWMAYGVPIAVIGLALAWVYLVFIAYPSPAGDGVTPGTDFARAQYRALGAATPAEKRVAAVFAGVAVLWITRGLLQRMLAAVGLGSVDDTVVAVAGALALFLIPSGPGKRERLVDATDLVNLPWGILLLFGGGLALARGIESSGAARWAAEQLAVLQGLSPVFVTALVVTLVTAVTQVTSNTSTATVFMPVAASLAAALGTHPYLLMVPVATAASCAFVLPVATPPNAIVFGTGHVPMKEMVRSGLGMNLIFIVLITAAITWWLPRAWSLPAVGGG